MPEMSPAAQTVLNKAFCAYDEEALYTAPAEKHAGMVAAAALRAAADQVVPEMRLEDVPGRFVNGCCHSQGQRIRSDLLAIAAELEGGNV